NLSALTQSLSAFGPIYQRSRKVYQRSAQFISARENLSAFSPIYQRSAQFISVRPNLSALSKIYQHSHDTLTLISQNTTQP
ncbi:hypothetical protein, partial [Alkalibacillus haloalkaliphilus]|uniref:hypothetical protein n=1 Tax=Alkalibacillus haloalkaliphilus TaxID=94136 RepID=UPI00293537CF